MKSFEARCRTCGEPTREEAPEYNGLDYFWEQFRKVVDHHGHENCIPHVRWRIDKDTPKEEIDRAIARIDQDVRSELVALHGVPG